MPACDICNAEPGPDATRYTADQLRHAVDIGYRPKAAIETSRRLGAMFGLERQDKHWYREWVTQVRRDPTDWLLCRPCAKGLDAHLTRSGTRRRWRRRNVGPRRSVEIGGPRGRLNGPFNRVRCPQAGHEAPDCQPLRVRW